MSSSDLGKPECKTCGEPIHSYPVTAKCSRDGECWECLVDKYRRALRHISNLLTMGKGPQALEEARRTVSKALGRSQGG